MLNKKENIEIPLFEKDIRFCSSASCSRQFLLQEKICFSNYGKQLKSQSISSKAIFSFGIHPQEPDEYKEEFLFTLIKEKRIAAIGECGFDMYTDNYKSLFSEQKIVWHMQLDYAVKYGLPIVIHCRKALPIIFTYTSKLKCLPSVIFHGWAGSINEASSFLRKGVNAFFCIGKGLLRGQKTQREAASRLDIQRILTETDAPYMNLKKEDFSVPSDIKKITSEILQLRNLHAEELLVFLSYIEANFNQAFMLS